MLGVPPAYWLQARATPQRLRQIGQIALSLGILGVAGVAGNAQLAWWQTDTEMQRYIWQRMLFVVATTTDLPFGQLAVIGSVLWWLGRWRVVAKA
jgi:hypothetical protein